MTSVSSLHEKNASAIRESLRYLVAHADVGEEAGKYKGIAGSNNSRTPDAVRSLATQTVHCFQRHAMGLLEAKPTDEEWRTWAAGMELAYQLTANRQVWSEDLEFAQSMTPEKRRDVRMGSGLKQTDCGRAVGVRSVYHWESADRPDTGRPGRPGRPPTALARYGALLRQLSGD